MRYLSVCSGIEAASVAWHHLGWTPVAFSEIEPFPAAVLKHRFPNVPNYGDMTRHAEWPIGPGSIDLLVGGTPCQAFSVAGLRGGLSDPRGGLMLTYLEIARRLRPKWVVWENVPGVLSSGGGRDFGAFLGALGELGYGWAYRVIDAQYCRVDRRWPKAVPQRRRRVFVVGCFLERDPRGRERAAEVLALGTGLRWHLEEGAKARKAAPADAEAGARADRWPARVASTLNHAFGDKLGLEDQHALNGAPLFVPDVVGALTAKGPTGMGAPEIDAQHYVASRATWWDGSDCAGTLTKQNAGGGQRMPDKDNFGAVLQPVAGTLGSRGLRSHTELDGHGAYIPVAFSQNQREEVREVEVPGALAAEPGTHQQTYIAQPVPYDLFQITAPVNRQNRKPGDPCHTLARDNAAHAAVVGTDLYNGSITGDVAATMGTPGSSVNASGPTVMAFKPGQSAEARSLGAQVDVACTLEAGGGGNNKQAVAFDWQSGGDSRGLDPKDTAQLQRCQTPAVHHAMTVRRLTPRECERLQGFPDDWTLIPWRGKPAEQCPDGPRYKALGNSMAVNCMAWIGERIAAVEAANA